MEGYTNSTILTVRYGETDQMGVVYHANYINYFEIGRTEWLRSLGLNYKDMESSGVMLPVISLNCNYKKSALYDDNLTIKTTLVKTPSVRIEFNYEITNQNEELITTGSTMLVFLNKKTRKPMRCPQYILDYITKPL